MNETQEQASSPIGGRPRDSARSRLAGPTSSEEAGLWLTALVNSSDDAILSKTLDGMITSWNPAAQRIYGYAAEEIIEQPIALLIPPERLAEFTEIMLRLRQGERIEPFETVRVRRDGSRIAVSVSISPIIDARGQLIGASTIARDITERKHHAANLAFLAEISEDLARLSTAAEIMQTVSAKIGAFLHISNCLFAGIDEGRDVASIDHAWNAAKGTPDVRGVHRLSEYITEEFRQAARRGETVVIRNTQTDPRTDAEGYAAFNIHAYVTVPFMRSGEWKYLFTVNDAVARDWRADEIELIQEITNRIFPRLERARAEAALRQAQGSLEVALEAARLGAWDTDLRTLKTHTNLRDNQIFGYTEPVAEWGLDLFRQHVLPEDRAKLDASIAEATERGESTLEVRVRRLDGQVRWISSQGRVYYDEAGTPIRVAGVTQDITERKQAEEALRKSEKRHSFLLTLSDALKEVGGAREIITIAAEQLGRHLAIDHVGYAEIDATGAYFTLHTIWDQRGTPDLSVQYELAAFGPALIAELRQGRTVAVADAFTHHLTQGVSVAAAYTATDTRAVMIVPLIKDGRYVASFYAMQHLPRSWTEEERTLTEEVANRIWATVERARSEAALRASEAQLTRELEDTKTLQAISRLFIEEENIDSLYEQLLTAAMALMGAACGNLQMVDEEQQKLRWLAWKGFHPEAAAYWQTVAFDSATISASAFRSGERLVVPDVRTSELLVGSDSLKYYELSGIVAVQSTPLISRSGRLVGMISTHWREPHEPHERELRLLDVLARQAADVLERKLAESALRQAQESLELALEAARLGVFDVDLNTLKVHTNLRHNQIFGVTEPVTEWPPDFFRQYILPEDYTKIDASYMEALANGESYREYRVRRPDGQVRWLYAHGRVYYDDAGRPMRMVGVMQDITERKQAEETQARLLREVEQQRTLLRRLNRTLARTQEHERQELARNLHDLVGQNLTALNLYLKLIQTQLAASLPETDSVDASLGDARKLVEQVTVQVRDVMSELRPPMLNDYGVLAALRWYATQVVRRTGLTVNVQGEQAFPRLPEEIELNLFRIAQEAINNVAKHAEATQVMVTLVAEDRGIRLTVTDNGRGMVWADPATAEQPPGLGVLIMRERAVTIGGRFEMQSGLGEGTTIIVEVDR